MCISRSTAFGVRQEHDELADEYEADGIGQLEQEREVDRDRRRRAPADLQERAKDVASLRRREERREVRQ